MRNSKEEFIRKYIPIILLFSIFTLYFIVITLFTPIETITEASEILKALIITFSLTITSLNVLICIDEKYRKFHLIIIAIIIKCVTNLGLAWVVSWVNDNYFSLSFVFWKALIFLNFVEYIEIKFKRNKK